MTGGIETKSDPQKVHVNVVDVPFARLTFDRIGCPGPFPGKAVRWPPVPVVVVPVEGKLN